MTGGVAISLDDQVACVARELALRRGVYGKWVAKGSMTQAAADKEIARMSAVLDTLKALQTGGMEPEEIQELL